jgi:hypothetical protein
MTLAVVRVWCYTCGMKIISKIACTVLALGVTACSKEPTGETSSRYRSCLYRMLAQCIVLRMPVNLCTSPSVRMRPVARRFLCKHPVQTTSIP